jgi:tetratricopeptide (TPR) repeat protein
VASQSDTLSLSPHFLLLTAGNTMAIDLNALWDYTDPALSESRFREALQQASAQDVPILQTQIARTFGLRRRFDEARTVLASIAPRIESESPEAQTRYFLELGRTHASPAHPPEAGTPANREIARSHYMRAFQVASDAKLDALAIDALHMMPMVDTDAAQQLEWNQKALDFMERSSQPAAKRWEASLRNNVGYAKHLAGDYDGALRQFRLSLAAHERAGNAYAVRIAHWMIAWTYRAQQRYAEAIDIQLRLEREWDAAGKPSQSVYDELEHLYRALGDDAKAAHYQALLAAKRPGTKPM